MKGKSLDDELLELSFIEPDRSASMVVLGYLELRQEGYSERGALEYLRRLYTEYNEIGRCKDEGFVSD